MRVGYGLVTSRGRNAVGEDLMPGDDMFLDIHLHRACS
jgi:hypothetical protein